MQDPEMKKFGSRQTIFKNAFSWLMVFFILPAFAASQSWGGKVVSPATPGKTAAPPVLTSPPSPTPPGKTVAPPSAAPSRALAVMTKTIMIDAGRIQTGDFFALFVFTIRGDLDKVAVFLEASDLYKGGDPRDPDRAGPIALNTGKPAEITGEFAAGSRNTAFWRGAGNPISGFPCRKTETLIYGTASGGHFSQDVSCKIWYIQPVAAKPAGKYSGVVRLNTMAAP